MRVVLRLIERLGFDAVDGRPLVDGQLLRPDGGPYAETFSAAAPAERLR